MAIRPKKTCLRNECASLLRQWARGLPVWAALMLGAGSNVLAAGDQASIDFFTLNSGGATPTNLAVLSDSTLLLPFTWKLPVEGAKTFEFYVSGFRGEDQGQYITLEPSIVELPEVKSAQQRLVLPAIRLDVSKAYRDTSRSFEEINRGKKARKIGRALLFFAKSNKDIGIGNPVQMKDALIKFNEARFSHVKSIFDYNVSLAKLSQAVGEDLISIRSMN